MGFTEEVQAVEQAFLKCNTDLLSELMLKTEFAKVKTMAACRLFNLGGCSQSDVRRVMSQFKNDESLQVACQAKNQDIAGLLDLDLWELFIDFLKEFSRLARASRLDREDAISVFRLIDNTRIESTENSAETFLIRYISFKLFKPYQTVDYVLKTLRNSSYALFPEETVDMLRFLASQNYHWDPEMCRALIEFGYSCDPAFGYDKDWPEFGVVEGFLKGGLVGVDDIVHATHLRGLVYLLEHSYIIDFSLKGTPKKLESKDKNLLAKAIDCSSDE